MLSGQKGGKAEWRNTKSAVYEVPFRGFRGRGNLYEVPFRGFRGGSVGTTYG